MAASLSLSSRAPICPRHACTHRVPVSLTNAPRSSCAEPLRSLCSLIGVLLSGQQQGFNPEGDQSWTPIGCPEHRRSTHWLQLVGRFLFCCVVNMLGWCADCTDVGRQNQRGGASVNHLHFQGWYFNATPDGQLPVESAPYSVLQRNASLGLTVSQSNGTACIFLPA